MYKKTYYVRPLSLFQVHNTTIKTKQFSDTFFLRLVLHIIMIRKKRKKNRSVSIFDGQIRLGTIITTGLFVANDGDEAHDHANNP